MSEPRYPYVCLEIDPSEVDLASSHLWDLGALGVEERDDTTLNRAGHRGTTLIGHFATPPEAERALAKLSALFSASPGFIEGDAWKHEWKRFFRPTCIGEKLLVRPSWEPISNPTERLVITIDPGNAFGSGTHETTRLCLRALETLVRGGETVLDVGCGSGILSIAAARLGASRVVAIDVEEPAIEATRENAALNDVRCIEPSLTPLDEVRGTFDVVVANIRASVLIPNASSLGARRAERGACILSGILAEEQADIAAAFSGFGPATVYPDGEWVAFVYRGAH